MKFWHLKILTPVFFFLFLLINFSICQAQQPLMKIDSVGVCNESSVSVHLRGKFLNNIGAMTLYIHYPSESLTFKTVENVNPLIKGLLFNELVNPSRISIVWSSTTGVSFQDAILLDLKFDVISPMGSLHFSIDSCEVADAGIPPQVISMQFQDGYVTSNAPVINQNPTNKFIPPGANCVLIVSASNASGYRWQESRDYGVSWNYLINGPAVTGALTDHLQLMNMPVSSNGYQYRCEISLNSCSLNSQRAVVYVDKLYFIENDETSNFGIRLYPNPASSNVVMELNCQKTGLLETELISVNGCIIRNSVIEINEPGVQKFDINIVYLQVGLYTCRYRFTSGKSVYYGGFKFIKYE